MIGENIIFTGTQQLIMDLCTRLVLLAPIVAIILTIVFAIARSGCDEMDQKKWTKRIANSWVGCLIAVAASSIVGAIFSYYS